VGKARVKRWQQERAKQRRLLRVAFAVMELMFFVELGFGLMTVSAALQIDVLETASSKPMTDAVLGRKISAQHEVILELAGGLFAIALCLWVISVVIWNTLHHLMPNPRVMAAVSVVGIMTNAAVGTLFYRDRLNSATLRAAWTTSRNDLIGNVCVLLAAIGVYVTGRNWPDALAAAAIIPFALYRATTAIKNARAVMVKSAQR
jgi:Co/Zn/Cd efflux system component